MQRQTRMNVDIEWAKNDLMIGEVRQSKPLSGFGSEHFIEGVEAFALIKLTNTSDFTVTVDRVRLFYPSDDGLISTSRSDMLLDRDLQREIIFPVKLEAGESMWFIALIPLSITNRVAGALASLRSNSLHSSDEVLAALKRDTIIAARIDRLDYWILGGASNRKDMAINRCAKLPQWLLELSDATGTVRRGERKLKVLVSLGSGAVIDTLFDYIDINASVTEW